MPRVTLGMPVYNGTRFLDETLRALLAQSYKDFELVISDNASTDATGDVCRRYAATDSRIRYYRENENRGAAWNYNRVVELATGEYFKWAAHDDLITSDYLEKCVSVLDRDPSVVLCCTDDQDIDEQGNHVDARRESHIPGSERGSAHKPSTRFRRLIRDDYDCEQVFGLMRTEQLRRTKLILPYTDSDRTLLGELALYGRFHEIQERLFLHRQHGQSSGKANPIAAGWHVRAGWFDPSLQGKVLFSRWRQLKEYLIAIRRAPIGMTERLICVFWMVAYFRGRAQSLSKEIVMGLRLLWLKVAGNRPASSPSAPTQQRSG